MKIYWPHLLYILFLSLEFIFSVEYLKKNCAIEIECDNNNILIFDSSTFPIPSTIHFKFSIDSNSFFDKVISFEYDLIEINNELTEINNELIEVNKNINYTGYIDYEYYNENDIETNIENSINISNEKIDENNKRNYAYENHKFRYIIFSSGESVESINNINYNIIYFNIDKNKARVEDKFGNNLLINFNCKGILKIENTEKDLSSKLSTIVIIGIVAGGVLIIIIIIIVLVCYFKKNMKKNNAKKINKKLKKKKIKNENKETEQNKNNYIQRSSISNGIFSRQRFKRSSFLNSTKSSVNRIKKRKKKS